MKRCKHCNNRVVQDYDGDIHCAECGRNDWYETDGIARKSINAYLRKSGWECLYSDTAAPPLRTVERWRKKEGYGHNLFFHWLRRLDSSSAMMIEDEQIWRAINHIADSEGIGYAEAAERVKEVHET